MQPRFEKELDIRQINNLDPRAFIKAPTGLWVTEAKSPKSPLLNGHLYVPIRLIDFCRENCVFEETYPEREKAIKLALAYWEMNNKETERNLPPYQGSLSLYTPNLFHKIEDKYQRGIRTINRKNKRYKPE